MHTVATIAYDSVNPFELAVATETFGFQRLLHISPQPYRHTFHREKVTGTASVLHR